MVEDQQGIRTVLTFGTKSVDPKILEQLLIGRDKNADQLFKSIEGIVRHGNNQQTLVIGQRGMGKTHLLRILYSRSQTFLRKGEMVIAYFSEEEYGIASYFDFLTRVLNAFIRWNEKDAEFLRQKLEELQDTAIAAQPRFLEDIIREYIATRPLVILAENFGDILDSLGRQEQGKLRAWLYENPRISIIATSQSISANFETEDRPFYGFFQLYYLKPLSFEDSERFLIQLARLDGRRDIIEHLENKGKAQVRAIHELVKGNHRLLVTFYEFLKSDLLAKLSDHFIKTINDLKPYYESYIRYLPPQQQKILRYIALARKPQQGTLIAKNCFIDQKSLSKQLSELVRKKLVETVPDQLDKRNKLYDVNEPLLRISIEIGEHKEGITALFIDFLALYYDNDELENKKLKYLDLLENCDDGTEKIDFQYEIQAIDKALSLKKSGAGSANIFGKVHELIDQGQINKAEKLIENEKAALGTDFYNFLLSFVYVNKSEYSRAAKLISTMSDEYRKTMNGMWAYVLFQLSKQKNNKKLLRESLNKFEVAAESGESDFFLYSNWGKALSRLALLDGDIFVFYEAQKKLKRATELDSQNVDIYIELAVCEIAIALHGKDERMAVDAFENFQIASSIDPNNIGLLRRWSRAISFTYILFQKPLFNIENFRDKLSQLSAESRNAIWKDYMSLQSFYVFKEFFPLLRVDLMNNAEQLPVIIDWINLILAKNLRSLDKDDVAFLRGAVLQMKTSLPELEISLIFIDVFEDYVVNGNKNAIYELTKEQRIFFLKHIIGERAESGA